MIPLGWKPWYENTKLDRGNIKKNSKEQTNKQKNHALYPVGRRDKPHVASGLSGKFP